MTDRPGLAAIVRFFNVFFVVIFQYCSPKPQNPLYSSKISLKIN
jgi:hypothetical protein